MMSKLQDDVYIDRIKQFLERSDGNMEEKLAKSQVVMDAFKELIEVCGDDPQRDGLQETPYRVLKAFLEYTEGYHEDPKSHLEKQFDVAHDEVIIVKDIDFNSLCEHHFAPIFGVAHVGYIPNGKITGLSKIARTVDGYAKRFQVQERLSNEIADAMNDVLQPKGVIVVIEATHMCMCGRGVKKKDSLTVTTSSRGVYRDDRDLRKEFMALIKE